MHYERILLPVAGDPDEEVLGHAVRLADAADAADASIHVLNVVDERRFPDPSTLYGDDAADTATDDLRSHLESEGIRAIRTVEEALSGRVTGTDLVTHVEQGIPADVICRYADRNDIDVVVMATHTRATTQEQLLGSVTERVIRASTIPVLVIPPSITAAGRSNADVQE